MRQWAILATATAAVALAAACGSSSSSGNNAEDGGGSTTPGSGSGSSSGSTPVIPLEAGAVSFACTSASGCTAPQVCCGTFGVTSAVSACATGPCPAGATAGGFGQQICGSSDECPAENSCLPLQGFSNVSVCVDDDSGSTGYDFGQGDGAVFLVESGAPPAEAGPSDAGHPVEASAPEEAGTVDASHPIDAAEGATEAGPHDAASGG